MATYSLAFAGCSAANPQQPLNHIIDDAACNTPAAEQRAAMLGTVFNAQAVKGGPVFNYKYDAERSIPGVLRILNRA